MGRINCILEEVNVLPRILVDIYDVDHVVDEADRTMRKKTETRCRAKALDDRARSVRGLVELRATARRVRRVRKPRSKIRAIERYDPVGSRTAGYDRGSFHCGYLGFDRSVAHDRSS